MRIKRLFAFALILAALIGISMVGINTVACQLEIPRVVLHEPLDRIVPTADYQTAGLVNAAKEIVEDQVSSVAVPTINGIFATFICEGQDCRLIRIAVEIVSERQIGCLHLEAERAVGYTTTTDFIFDISENSVTASTIATPKVPLINVKWQELPIDMDQAISIARLSAESDFALDQPYRLLISLYPHDWRIAFNSDLTGQRASDLQMSVDYLTGRSEIIE